MAKGDHQRLQDAADSYKTSLGASQQNLNNATSTAQSSTTGNYNSYTPQNLASYGNIMNGYQSMFNNPFSPQSGGNSMPVQPQGGMSYPGGNSSPSFGMGPNNGIMSPQNAPTPFANGMTVNGQNTPFMSNSGSSSIASPSTSPQSTPPQYKGSPTDANAIRQFVIDTANATGQPSIAQNPDYWVTQILGKGGINDAGGYWTDLIGKGGNQDSGAGGSSGGGPGDPSLGSFGLSMYPAALAQTMAGYSDFANTGGFSPQDIQDLRARAISPIRSVYQNAQNDLTRERRLNGGMPNYGAATSQMARNMGQQVSDANTNVDADIASMRQSGRLAGVGGLANLGMFGAGSALNEQNLMAQLRQGALNGQTSLFGSQPGMTSTLGNQMLGAGSNMIGAQNANSNQANTVLGGYRNMAGTPGNFQSAMGNIGSFMNLAGGLVSPISSLFGGGGGMGMPTNPSGTSAYNMYGAGGPTYY